MRKILLIVTILGGALAWSHAGNAEPGLTVYGNAPIGPAVLAVLVGEPGRAAAIVDL
jgi:hypothetical protein